MLDLDVVVERGIVGQRQQAEERPQTSMYVATSLIWSWFYGRHVGFRHLMLFNFMMGLGRSGQVVVIRGHSAADPLVVPKLFVIATGRGLIGTCLVAIDTLLFRHYLQAAAV